MFPANSIHLPLLGGDKKNDDHQCERLFVKIKSGDTTEIEIDISENETVDDLKKKLIQQLNIVGKRIRLIASGRMLEPGNKSLISDFKVNTGAFIHLVITENIIHQSPNGTALSQNSASVPTATVYRGLDQLNAGVLRLQLGSPIIKHKNCSFFVEFSKLCLIICCERQLMSYYY